MSILAATEPSHGTLGVLFLVAVVLFAVGAILAWITPPQLHRAVAFIAAGLAFCAVAWCWIEFAAA